MTITILR